MSNSETSVKMLWMQSAISTSSLCIEGICYQILHARADLLLTLTESGTVRSAKLSAGPVSFSGNFWTNNPLKSRAVRLHFCVGSAWNLCLSSVTLCGTLELGHKVQDLYSAYIYIYVSELDLCNPALRILTSGFVQCLKEWDE